MTIPDTLSTLAIPLVDLINYPGNPRRGNVSAIMESLRIHGQYRPVVVNRRTMQVLAGNHTVLAARELGWTQIAATFVDVDDEQAARIVLVDNRSNDLGGYDDADLLALLESLPDVSGTLYDGADLAALLRAVRPPGQLTDPDDAPPVPVVPVTAMGDVWELGPHRVVCGDATKRDTLVTLLGAERPDLLLSDPPYGVAFGEGTSEGKAIRGDLSQAVIPIGFAVALEAISDDARIYLFGGSTQFPMYLGLWDHHLHALPRLIVWIKDGFVLRQVGYHSQFECIYFGWKGKGGGPKFWWGDRKGSDVWDISRDGTASRVHPTQKPVAVLTRPIVNSCPPSGLVLDPFAGSGSTLIACHDTGRVARCVELDPLYVDVICHRWQNHTGEQPIRAGVLHDFTVGA